MNLHIRVLRVTVQCSVVGLRAGVVDQLAVVCGQRLELPGEDVLLHLQHLAAAPEARQLVHVGVAWHEVGDVRRHMARSPEHLIPSKGPFTSDVSTLNNQR